MAKCLSVPSLIKLYFKKKKKNVILTYRSISYAQRDRPTNRHFRQNQEIKLNYFILSNMIKIRLFHENDRANGEVIDGRPQIFGQLLKISE